MIRFAFDGKFSFKGWGLMNIQFVRDMALLFIYIFGVYLGSAFIHNFFGVDIDPQFCIITGLLATILFTLNRKFEKS